MNKIKMILVVSIILFGINIPSFAMMCDMGSECSHGEAHAETTEKSLAVNVGNSICPVGNEAVDGETTYEYQGKVYNFCCPMCIDTFKKNPQQYIEKIEAQSKSAFSKANHEGHPH